MEHACRDSGSVHPQRCSNVTVTYRVAITVGITIDVAINVNVTITSPVDVESVITISERNEFDVNFRFTVTDIR